MSAPDPLTTRKKPAEDAFVSITDALHEALETAQEMRWWGMVGKLTNAQSSLDYLRTVFDGQKLNPPTEAP